MDPQSIVGSRQGRPDDVLHDPRQAGREEQLPGGRNQVGMLDARAVAGGVEVVPLDVELTRRAGVDGVELRHEVLVGQQLERVALHELAARVVGLRLDVDAHDVEPGALVSLRRAARPCCRSQLAACSPARPVVPPVGCRVRHLRRVARVGLGVERAAMDLEQPVVTAALSRVGIAARFAKQYATGAGYVAGSEVAAHQLGPAAALGGDRPARCE
jgi:hypothetical protein